MIGAQLPGAVASGTLSLTHVLSVPVAPGQGLLVASGSVVPVPVIVPDTSTLQIPVAAEVPTTPAVTPVADDGPLDLSASAPVLLPVVLHAASAVLPCYSAAQLQSLRLQPDVVTVAPDPVDNDNTDPGNVEQAKKETRVKLRQVLQALPSTCRAECSCSGWYNVVQFEMESVSWPVD